MFLILGQFEAQIVLNTLFKKILNLVKQYEIIADIKRNTKKYIVEYYNSIYNCYIFNSI